MRSYNLYIDGEDVEGKGWNYVVRSSAFLRDARGAFRLKRGLELQQEGAKPTTDVIGRCARSTPEHNEAAVQAARKAAPVYGAFPLEVRSRILRELHKGLVERAGEMIEILVAEGHPRRLAQWEVSGMLSSTSPATIDWYETQLRQEFVQDGRRLELVRKPDGVVCVNPPQNASGSNSTLGTFALLAGNAVVVKAPRTTPLSVMFLYRTLMAPVLERHGAPPGTLNIVSGPTGPILNAWIDHPLVDDILFFGDSEVGLKIGQRCLANGKKAVLELAGNDGFVVWKDADLDAAAKALEECFYGSSQICMVPKFCIVHPEVADSFIERLVERVRKIRPGYPEDPEVLLSPVLKIDRFFDYMGEAVGAGGQVLCGGGRVDVDGMSDAEGMFCEPTVMRIEGLETAGRLSAVREETFFPLLPVVVPERAADEPLLDQILGYLNANKYGLRNSVWTRDEALARRIAQRISNGGLLKINDSHIGFTAPLSTHGGTGLTGGPYGELNYVGIRTSHLQGIAWGDGDPRPLDPRVA